MDTPGLRELQLWDATDGVSQAFADIDTLAAECRFSDCKHEGEPGCAVQAAVDAGTLDEARQAIEMGFLISFAGNVTYPKAQNLRDVAREIPLDRLLMETDSPFLAPQPHRGRRNEPAYVAEVAQTIGNVRNLPATQVAEMTSANFRRFFGLDRSGNRSGAVSGGVSSHF